MDFKIFIKRYLFAVFFFFFFIYIYMKVGKDNRQIIVMLWRNGIILVAPVFYVRGPARSRTIPFACFIHGPNQQPRHDPFHFIHKLSDSSWWRTRTRLKVLGTYMLFIFKSTYDLNVTKWLIFFFFLMKEKKNIATCFFVINQKFIRLI